MRGKEVFYPVGWDDNGLATERRVQIYYGVRCDPALPYAPSLTPPTRASGRALSPAEQLPVSRRNFVELCRELTEHDEHAYAQAWQRLGEQNGVEEIAAVVQSQIDDDETWPA